MPKKGEIDRRKLAYWKSVLTDFERSGLSGQAYCREKGIAYTAFANRRRRLAGIVKTSTKTKSDRRAVAEETSTRSSSHVGFAEVAIKASPTQAPSFTIERLELILLNGTVLRVPNGYSAAALAEIVLALEG